VTYDSVSFDVHLYEVETSHHDMAAIEAHGRRLVPAFSKASQCPAGPSPSISPNGRRHEIWVFEPTLAIEQTSLPSTQPSRQISVPTATIYTPLPTGTTVSGYQRASSSGLSAGCKAGIGVGITIGILTTIALAICSQYALKPRSTRSLKGKGKKTSEVETRSKATWKAIEPGVEDAIDGSSTISTTPDPMGSLFSAESSRTSMGGFSGWSMSSRVLRKQLQIATRVFVSVIQSDQVLGPIYESGRNDPTLEPRKLRGYVFETLISYAHNLKKEAKDHLEFIASHLVLSQASDAARCVSGDYKWTHGPTEDADDSSDDEVQEQPVDERQFNDDLDAFRSFLTQSNAFATLRDKTQLFYPFQPIITVTESPETLVGEDIPQHTEGSRSGKGLIRIFNDTAMFMITNLLVSLECLEPPLETGWTRVKIECHVSQFLAYPGYWCQIDDRD
jgi:hypothetical protein